MVVVYSQSRSVNEHIANAVKGDVDIRASLSPPMAQSGNVYLVHAASFPRRLTDWLEAACQKGVVIAIAADIPDLEDMLSYTQMGVRGYYNSYMSAPNYAQMIDLLSRGQSWFPPQLLNEAFALAQKAMRRTPENDPLEILTKREREVALSVAEGHSNREIASDFEIKERTVKSHLTHIFKKLAINDRVALVIFLKQFDAHQG